MWSEVEGIFDAVAALLSVRLITYVLLAVHSNTLCPAGCAFGYIGPAMFVGFSESLTVTVTGGRSFFLNPAYVECLLRNCLVLNSQLLQVDGR